jgi:wyosine [tRNA(Phe)-imidazoG37] synthetase (radical SAM superfamily)
MALSIFDWMKQVTYIRDPWYTFSEEDKENFNVYMLHKVISMHEPYIDLANYLQKLWLLTPEQIYNIYCSYLPENKIFAKYIKSSKPKPNQDLVNILATHYQVSTREVKSYLHILCEDEIKNILTSRGVNEDEIQKLLNEKSTKTSKTSTRT